MNGYLVHFAVYSFAMIGFICIALFVYKKSMYISGNSENKNYLRVENTLRLTPGKTLYVIKAGNEKFLIAGDNASTTMLSKLEKGSDEVHSFEHANSGGITEIPSLRTFTKRSNKG